MKYIGLVIALFLISLKVSAQQFYVCNSNYNIQSVTITNGVCSSQNVNACTGVYLSIAMQGNNFYYSDGFGVLYKGNITNGIISNCSVVANLRAANNALTVDNNGVVYYVAGGTGLYKVNPANPVPVFLGTLPYSSGGDLTFYNNQLYMASGNAIIKVDMNNPAASTVYLPIPNATYGSLYGLVTVNVNNVYKVYAFGTLTNSTNLIELDMPNQAIVGITCTLPYIVYDAASIAEAGTVKTITVDQIAVTQQCDTYNQGKIQITCVPDTDRSTLTYTLNNTSNTTGLFTRLAPGRYAIKIASSNGATKDTTAIVPDYSLTKPVVQVTKTNPVCGNPSVIKFSSNNNMVTTIRTVSAQFPISHVFTGLPVGGYHFTALDQNGCIVDTLYVGLKLDACPVIKIDSIAIKQECSQLWKGNAQVYCTSHPDTYTYSVDQTITNTTGIFSNLSPGTHALNITSNFGFTKDTTFVVPDYSIINRPAVTYHVKNQLCDLPGQVALTINGVTDTTYKVKLSSGSKTFASGHVFTGLVAGKYNFSVFSRQGCFLDTLSVAVGHDLCKPVIFPNTFTPNNDGVNDVFKPTDDGNATNYFITIYDRFGAVVFTSSSIYPGWDGRYKGSSVSTGTYYWVITYTSIDGRKNTQSGSVTLLR
ncbi:gliding motility-associated C-terminal domain-containing protein [Mucilaginibacter sp. AW1-3]